MRFKEITILFLCMLLIGCSKKTNDDKYLYTSNLEHFENKIIENDVNQEYKSIISLEVANPIVKKESNDSDLDLVSYDISFKNISNKDILFGVKVYLSQAMTEKFILNQSPLDDCGNSSEVIIKSNEGYRIEAERLALPRDKLTKEERKIYDENIGCLYIEIHIDQNVYYEKISINA